MYDLQGRYIRKKKLGMTPKQLFDKDINEELTSVINKGIQAVLMIDANEDVIKGEFSVMIQAICMENIFAKDHLPDMLPAHHAGSTLISTIYASPSLVINQSGILQKGVGFQADQQNMFVDFDIVTSLGAPMFKFTGEDLQGTGQDNTGAAPYWTYVSTFMVEILKEELLHATFVSPITSRENYYGSNSICR